MTNIDTSFISDNISGGEYTSEQLLETLLTKNDVELGKLVVPFAEEAAELWAAWGAEWRRLANAKLAEDFLDAEEDIEGMFPIVPEEEIDGLFASGYHFEVVNLSRDNWAARLNGQDQDGDWELYSDVEDLKEEYAELLAEFQKRAHDF